MGYNITIGNLKTSVESEGLYTRILLDAEGVRNDDAPAYGEPTDYTNQRWPSYSSWGEFLRFTNLYDLFKNEEHGLMRKHPGCYPINSEHKAAIDAAYEKFKESYPDAKAGYSPKINEKEGVYDDPEWPKENGYLVRLEWLKYWVDWALANCENPVIENS